MEGLAYISCITDNKVLAIYQH